MRLKVSMIVGLIGFMGFTTAREKAAPIILIQGNNVRVRDSLRERMVKIGPTVLMVGR